MRATLDKQYTRKSVINRTVTVKVENDDYSPNPDALLDIKTKLIGDQTLLSVKSGSWHSDAARQEYEINFRREDLADLFAILQLLGYRKFITLSTIRTTWTTSGVIVTLDEYHQIGKALFEVELEDESSSDATRIDEIFFSLGVQPMDSAQTVNFISGLNRTKEIQVDLDRSSPSGLAQSILAAH